MNPLVPIAARRIALLALALACTSTQAAELPRDTVVRVQASGIEAGWHPGRIFVTPSGCTMVKLDTKTKGGYTMVSLKGASQLQRKDGSGWADVPVKALAKQEPKPCQEGDND
jgi:hypothetical protein